MMKGRRLHDAHAVHPRVWTEVLETAARVQVPADLLTIWMNVCRLCAYTQYVPTDQLYVSVCIRSLHVKQPHAQSGRRPRDC